jgi:pyruvate-ferredoxin/flavodoxin oxidoreductase
MANFKKATMDGNTAASHVAYAFSDVAAIYPITPSSPMGEMIDVWSAYGRKNIFGEEVDVAEMQSEAGASGAVHGSLSAGALTTTFTASQGLMLMLPVMHKIAGEMLPAVFHVSARSLAAQSLSIFGDHSDVMSARNTGFAMLAANSIQEIMDLALVAHLSSIKSRIPFLHFFDGFRTSHEIQKIEVIDYDIMKDLVDTNAINEFRKRALNPQHPLLKVGAQNPDVYFQGRETVNKYYDELPELVQNYMNKVSEKVGRKYRLFDYVGEKEAKKIIILMGSGAETVEETINYLNAKGEKLGLIKVRLYRPFSVKHFIDAIPQSVNKIAVLDRTKEPGAIGEPLYLDVVTALKDNKNIKIVGGRYGLSSKEFTPSMVKAVYDYLDGECKHGFTVGINDDVTRLSISVKEEINTIPEGTISCKFWGLGSDGTVGANKNSIKIIGDNTELYAQGYFQYDSKKSGGITRSHLRFGKTAIQSPYLVKNADFIACHNPAFIGRYDIIEGIKEGGVFLINSQWSKDEVFENMTKNMQEIIIKKKVKLYNINALEIAQKVGLGQRINTVMQAAFFIISEVLPREDAINLIKKSIEKSYLKKGKDVVEMNWKAVDLTNEALVPIDVPGELPSKYKEMKKLVPDNASDFVKTIVEPIMREKGDDIKVSEMPLDGAVELGTTKYEKRGIAPIVPSWNSDKCIQCNQCSFVCPHAAIRPKLIDRKALENAPKTFKTLKAQGKDGDLFDYKMQVYIDDCQACGVCVEVCPVDALEMKPIEEERAAGETENYKFFETLEEDVKSTFIKETTVKGSQFKQPLLEFSGACAGCGETPYAKLLTQLFGDRMIIANATGCSSIWGGTFPNIPYCANKNGHGPAWANSLFEDNAEYGLGMRLAVEANRKQLLSNVKKLSLKNIDAELVKAFKYAIENWSKTDSEAKENAMKIKTLLNKINAEDDETSELIAKVKELKDYFIDKSVWAIGGDGWAYDIGYGGLDHVMASGKNINILVLDTEVYSNTGGQASKATQLGAVAKFAEAGKTTTKKDLGRMMMSYGYVYVASVSMGADKNQLVKAMMEAEAYDGPSIIMAYAPCINHGINMTHAEDEEKLVVDSGYWLLYRYNPLNKLKGKNPFILESKEPNFNLVEKITNGEKRYSSLERTFPDNVPNFRKGLIEFFKERYELYKKMAD